MTLTLSNEELFNPQSINEKQKAPVLMDRAREIALRAKGRIDSTLQSFKGLCGRNPLSEIPEAAAVVILAEGIGDKATSLTELVQDSVVEKTATSDEDTKGTPISISQKEFVHGIVGGIRQYAAVEQGTSSAKITEQTKSTFYALDSNKKLDTDFKNAYRVYLANFWTYSAISSHRVQGV
jgi:hypothetical protein